MLEIIEAGGWVMAPIILCSLLALAISAERLWYLRRPRIAPPTLAREVWKRQRDGGLTRADLDALQRNSALGQILAAGLANIHLDREAVKESIEDAGRHVVHELERYLNTLGTIASISPLLGLLGTVLGMIRVFFTITHTGVGDPGALAGGIAEALITTAAGLLVAIPTLFLYRYLRGKVEDLVVVMEAEAIKLMEAIYRPGESAGASP